MLGEGGTRWEQNLAPAFGLKPGALRNLGTWGIAECRQELGFQELGQQGSGFLLGVEAEGKGLGKGPASRQETWRRSPGVGAPLLFALP